MKRVLLIASTTGYQTQMFAAAARELEYEVVLATDRCHVLENPWGDEALAIRFDEPGSALEQVRIPPVDGIVALGDGPALVGARIAESLGLPYHPVDAVSACKNKFLARERFRDAGLPVPAFSRITLSEKPDAAAEGVRYPCVLKPLSLSASQGVIRADTPAEFVAAFERIRKILKAKDDTCLQVEGFIPGAELAVEGLVTGGELTVLALFDKPDPLNGPFFEETIYVTPSRQDAGIQREIRSTLGKAVRALGLNNGPIHAEMRVNADGVWMLEVAARPIGGLCARVLPGLPRLILEHAVTHRMPSGELNWGAAGVMMIPIPQGGVFQSVSGLEAAQSVPGIEDVVITVKQGQMLVPLPEGNSYLGFVFARAEEPAVAEQALRAAHRQLRFEISAALRIL